MRDKTTKIIVPSRGRPDNAVRLYEAIQTTAEVDVVFCLDDDDPKLDEYYDTKLPFRVDRRRRLVGTLNSAVQTYQNYYDIVGFMGDDVIPHTHRWDVAIANAFQPNMISYANDDWQGEGLPTAVFMDTNIVRRLGYMVTPTLIHLFADNYWKALGEALGTLTYLPDVNMEHVHPFAGKAADDLTYQEANAGPIWDHDQMSFNWYVANQLAIDVEHLRV
ncbi:glycosyltransferase [Streptomyces phage Tomas]|uniref:Glycosyltransferase n=1 Tax=Streptomyces phage Tomas TaxID=2914443 RepID=A0AA49BS87_9CAUD|nr:glycosyltransferase [Streptomyces phage Tomas]UMO76229.1 glycosyltransferase [Streptomyces phage Tomas]